LKTLGDHIRKRRLDLGLFQRQVAEQVGVDATCVVNWENNATHPAIRFMPSIIRFLGYNPSPKPDSLGERLITWRTTLGIRRRAAAKLMGVDEATLARWEKGEREPGRKHSNIVARVLGL